MDEEVQVLCSQSIQDENGKGDSELTPDNIPECQDSSGIDLCLEQKKNAYLHYLLSSNVQARSAEPDESRDEDSPQSSEQLERTYKKALSDYRNACNRLTSQMSAAGKTASELRSRLHEKDEQTEKNLRTLQKFREDTARQSSFANGKPMGDQFEELESQDMGEELERERLKFITNKVGVSQLEQKQRKKNELAGGVSDIEFNNLQDAMRRSEEKQTKICAEVQDMKNNEEKLLKLEQFLQTAIQNYTEKNQSKQDELAELNDEIEEKRSHLEHLNKISIKLKKQIGYDASDIGAFLQTRMVNDDFSSSRDELDKLHAKLNSLVLQHSELVDTS